MCAGNYDMMRLADQPAFLVRLTAPEDEHHTSQLGVYQFNDAIGQRFPSTPAM